MTWPGTPHFHSWFVCVARAFLVVTLGVTLLFSFPIAAGAATVSVSRATGGDDALTLFYEADQGEVNVVSVSRATDGYYDVVDDASVTIIAGPGSLCESVTNSHARCRPPIEAVDVDLLDGNDRLTFENSAYPEDEPPTAQAMTARGGDGRDTLIGGIGGDDFSGGLGDDPAILGGGGQDSMVGGDGNDILDGGDDADDTISGGRGNDTVLGGPGDDDGVAGNEGDDDLDGGDGNDAVRGDGGSDTVVGGAGADRLDLLPGSSEPSAGPDTLDGGPGDDVLNAGPPQSSASASQQGVPDRDTLRGGAGIDTADFSRRTAPLTIDLDDNADDGESGESDNVHSDVEDVLGGSNSDILTGSSTQNLLDGRGGEDIIEGHGGDDTLLGGANDPNGDTLSGGGGNDTMRGGSGDDSLEGADGDDGAFGGGGGDRVEGGPGNDALAGGAGADTVNGGDGDDSVNGGEPGLIGGDGPDELIGGPGADVLRGGRGNDLLDGGLGPDYIDGESETDTVTYAERTSEVFVTLDGQSNDGEVGEHDNVVDIERILGGILGDDLFGDAGANTIAGARGQDLIRGGLGPDRLLGGVAADVVMARDGVRDVVVCGGGKDLAIADRQDQVLECDTVDIPRRRRPIVGRSALVRPRGEFGLRLSQGRRFYPLADSVKIPMKSTIDPKAGVVRLTTARNRAGARLVASVSRGRFTVRQRGGRRPVTQLRLAGRRRDCGSSARASTRSLLVKVRKKGRRGNYEVQGKYSRGGSEGTAWITQDRCDGTLTTVLSGTVRVRDFGRRKTVTVRPGRPYLAVP